MNNVDQPTTKSTKSGKRSKGPRQTLALYQQQLCEYYQPIAYLSIYPGDEPVMVVTIKSIIHLPSTITSVSPTLVAVTVDKSILVPDNEAELEKLVGSSNNNLNEVIHF